MRFAGILSAGLLAACAALTGCDQAAGPTGLVSADAAKPGAKPDDAALAPPDSAFDYRYAFRLPASRIEAVQESHARGCDQLGPARCRITAMRYKVGNDNAIEAVLTLMLDPTVARAFGKAATQTVTNAHGTMTNADIAGADAAANAARAGTVVAQLREALANAEAQARTATTAEQKAQLLAKAERLRSAVATVGEVAQGANSGAATAPVVFRYASGGAIPGIGATPEATFGTASDTFLASLAGLLVVLAGVGPWIVLLLGGALLLRWILSRTEGAAAPVLPPAPRAQSDADRNVIQRWFARDDAKEHETVE